MKARPKTKRMWALLHLPSGIWDHGHSNETLYWAEHEAALVCRQIGDGKTWVPIAVNVSIARGK